MALTSLNTRMKIISLLLTGLLLSNSIRAQVPERTPNKIALIVAISKYPAISGWGELHSMNDIKLIKDVLLKQGFKPENIAVISDRQATMNGILAAFDRELIKKAHPGDIAVFHFSGHGQQIEDGPDHDEADGLDESIIPYDAPFTFRPGPDNHLRDDMLGKKLAALRQQLGPEGNLLVLVDACHSGTITRGGGVRRGSNEIYADPANKGKFANSKVAGDQNYGVVEEENNAAPMACFFASSPAESNQEATLPGENGGAGSLSLAFSRAMEKADTKTTYRGLFDNIKVEMSSLVTQQTPLAEGDLDKVLFGGKAVPRPVYYQIKRDSLAKTLTLQVGKIFGVFENTTFKLYKADTRPEDTAKTSPLALGKITEAGAYTSDIKLDRKLSTADMLNAWVYLDQVNYGDLAVRIKNNVTDPALRKIVATHISNIKQSKISDDAADIIIENGSNKFSGDSIYLVTSDAVILWQSPKSISAQNLYDSMAMKINNYSRADYIRNLKLENPEFKVIVEFIPVKCIENCDNPRSIKYEEDKVKKKQLASGKVVFKDGDKFRLKITSLSDQRILYYTVLDIQPDNKVNVMIPGKRATPEDFKILQGESVTLKNVFTVRPPYGVDVLKVIATEDPLDLRDVFDTRGQAPLKRGAKGVSPFEKIIKGTFNAEGKRTRGGDEDVISPDAVNISSLRFEIVK